MENYEMSDIVAFSLDYIEPEPVDDTQAKLLNNALRRFCDEVVIDEISVDEEKNVATRKVVWKYGSYQFRAKLITFDGQVSIGQFDYSPRRDWAEWNRLTTPRALAEKLTEAKVVNQK